MKTASGSGGGRESSCGLDGRFVAGRGESDGVLPLLSGLSLAPLSFAEVPLIIAASTSVGGAAWDVW